MVCDSLQNAPDASVAGDYQSLKYIPDYDTDNLSDKFDCSVTDDEGLTSRSEASVTVSIAYKWTVTFDSDGTPVPSQKVIDDHTATRPTPDPTKANNQFNGWAESPDDCSASDPRFDFDSHILKATTLYACWTPAPPQQNVPSPANSGSTVSGGLQGNRNRDRYTGPGISRSQVRPICSTSSVTGGCAALADGQDTKLLQATLGGNQSGSTSGFSISSLPGGVQLASVTRNSDGSFMLGLTSSTAGIYHVTVRYNGVVIGTVTVNFITGAVSILSASVGNSQVLTGYGFMPGELVTISVHSDPIQVARLAADPTGQVQATFVIPKGFGFGSHTAIFTGDRSGTATAPFTVTLAASTGGTVTTSPALAGMLMMAGLAAGALRVRRRSTQAG